MVRAMGIYPLPPEAPDVPSPPPHPRRRSVPADATMALDDGPDQAAADWSAIDRSLLEETRPPPVPFPLDVLPDTWRTWVEASAQGFTPVDYLAQGVLGAVAAVCGDIAVRVTASWDEPLLLWQARGGRPSRGKAPALRPAPPP